MRSLLLALLLVAPLAAAQSPAEGPRVIVVETEGNLESLDPVGCVAAATLGPAHTPADLFPGVVACVEQGDHPKAAALVLAARIRGVFDVQRVADGTAHQALLMLQESAFGSLAPADARALETALGEILNDGSPERAALCTAFRAQGPPTYHPRYMIQHGLRAFGGGEGDGIVEGFEPEAAWAEVLAMAECPAE